MASSSIQKRLEGALDRALKDRPAITMVLLTNAVTASYFLWVLSEGKPLAMVKRFLFRTVLSVVPQSVVSKEQEKVRQKIEHSVVGTDMIGVPTFNELPAVGLTKDAVTALLETGSKRDRAKWTSGKVSGSVYHGGDELSSVANEAFSRYGLSNPLHPDLFPSVRKMEAEIVSMTLGLFNGTSSSAGAVTSGGTESILMAIKAYRDFAKQTRGVTEPELVIPSTAHAAFDKACAYFAVRLRKVPVDPVTFKADPAAMFAAVNRNTIALVGSAPCFPQGVIDPIQQLAAGAAARGLPMHVDCCLGSFLIAMSEAAGHPVPPFDFRVPGVTSISADTHKYGFAPKGTSVIMYSENKYRHAQYFVCPEWSGGIYASPSIAGSRPGALIAGCWATLVHVGREGYLSAAKTILEAARTIAQGVRSVEQLELYGEPDLSVVCFGPRRSPGAKAVSIYSVADALRERGWNLNVLQYPACVHICVTFANAGHADEFVRDLRASVAEVLAAPKGKYADGAVAMYGMAESIPDKSIVADIANNFLDALYKAK